MQPPRSCENELILGLVSISDRASQGVYKDEGIPALEQWMKKAVTTPIKIHTRLIPDEAFEIEKTLRELVDIIGCDLVLTTGGTGPSRRDVTPEATLAVATREMPGFGEQMRAISGHFVPTAILSRQVAVLRETPDHAALIINLPGRPKAIQETLEGLKDEQGKSIVNGIFAAVPYCIDLIGGPYIETNPRVIKAFRPKNAQKPATKKDEPKVEAVQPQKPKTMPFAAEDLLINLPSTQQQEEPALTLIWMHGLGADHNDFAALPNEIYSRSGLVCRAVLPNAPLCNLPHLMNRPIRAWYDIHFDSAKEDDKGLIASAKRINDLIDYLEEHGIARDRIILGGFSQGAALALYTGLRQEKPLAGIVAFSGYLPLATRTYNEMTEAGLKTPILMTHGTYDDIIPISMAERGADLLSQYHPHVYWKKFPMAHEVCNDELDHLTQFLMRL